MVASAVSLAERFVSIESALERWQGDPLAHWHFAVDRIRQALELFTEPEPILELHLRACNKGTKTQTLAAYVVACLQQRQSLDGLELPRWRGPVEAVQLVRDYKQQVLSVQGAYLKLLGRWPHRARYQGAALESLRVMPLDGDPADESDWSFVHFISQKNVEAGTGVRGDVVAFDEPPKMRVLRELRKAGHAGRRFLILIGETPTVRSQWAELQQDYGDSPRRSIRRVDKERAECRWSLDEVADWVLSRDEKTALLRMWAHDPIREAREHGDYTSTEGKCPFNVPAIMRMITEMCRPAENRPWRITREATHDGEPATVITVQVEIFGPPRQGCRYYVCIDPASGVDDGRHNPAELQITEHGTGDLHARWNGYLAPFSLGVLAAGLALQYNQAVIDIEMKDHWGVNVVRGVTSTGYNNFAHERRELRPGEYGLEVGFDNDEETRTVIIGAVQEWIDSWTAGVKYGNCPSRDVFDQILDTELDPRGKIVAITGVDHAESLVCRGQSLRRCVKRSGRSVPEGEQPATPDDLLAKVIAGDLPPDYDLNGRRHRGRPAPAPLIPRLRPRT